VTKSERVLELINLLKTRDVMTIEEMCQVCGVTRRTIYRDLRMLCSMDVPVYYDEGYRFDRDRDFAPAELGTDEIELIYYCLKNNPLTGYPFFRNKFDLIERKITDRMRRKSEESGRRLFIRETTDDRVAPESSGGFLDSFSRSILTDHKVVIRFKGVDITEKLFLPVMIKVTKSGPFLVVTESSGEKTSEIAIHDVADLMMSANRFINPG